MNSQQAFEKFMAERFRIDVRHRASTNMASQIWDAACAWQAATEQGEPFAYYNPSDIYWIRNGGGVTFCGQKTEAFSEPVYTHPPKPTGGGVPDIKQIVIAAMQDTWDDWVGDTDSLPPDVEVHGPRTTRVSFQASTWADNVGRAVEHRLATQQPPEQ